MTTPTIEIHHFAARHADGALVIDVREPAEYVAGHVPGARLMPSSQMGMWVGQVPRGHTVYVICQSGNRSRAAADFINHMGGDAGSVDGGTSAWQQAGRPLVTGSSAS
ncbi:MAG: rhodanese-like domain-containing protein [Micrococcales bacterium]|nr:rhodanese-like domain-containing protein [Micrococcales bacterium]